MKSKKMIQVCSLILILLLAINLSFATEDSIPEKNIVGKRNTILSVPKINGKIAMKPENLFDNDESLVLKDECPYLYDLELIEDGDKFSLKSTLGYSNKTIPLTIKGVMYNCSETGIGKDFNNIYLAEIYDSENIHVVRLMVKDTKLSLVLQELDTKNMLFFEFPVGEKVSFDFNKIANTTLTNDDLDKKALHLYSVMGNLIDDTSHTKKLDLGKPNTLISSTLKSDTKKSSKTTMSQYAWDQLFQELHEQGSLTLSDFDGTVDTSMFKGGGWHYTYDENTDVIASFSFKNDSTEYLTQFVYIDTVCQSQTINGNIWPLRVQVAYHEGMVVSYNPYSDELKVLYYDYGIKIKNIKLAFNGLTNNAFFINRTTYKESQSGGNIVLAAISVYSPAANFYNLFQNLQGEEEQPNLTVVLFDDNYDDQMSTYNGSLIRGIELHFTNDFLTYVGHKAILSGDVKFNPNSFPSCRYGFDCTLRHGF